ncbi:hypothetical protein P170DRAFT_493291 [Aspergillus steynii IBT 23096]|uniref:Uncharacterized protein n=1 Tax=Aspergillus steynii IBT 23096 TaxID=1392250 RepID=A0A2I2GDT7_9EURO|nr:uncharacterized protein P170DRAFT_493291 [Aspergillus steynii IBT 23096]PLB51076.1 hypothetical protein P170DRAFT_493291 [Aspergillus steynii IBT 23096]
MWSFGRRKGASRKPSPKPAPRSTSKGKNVDKHKTSTSPPDNEDNSPAPDSPLDLSPPLSDLGPIQDSQILSSSSSQTSVDESSTPPTPQLEAFAEDAAKDNPNPSPSPGPNPGPDPGPDPGPSTTAPLQEPNAMSEDPEELVQQLLASLLDPMEEELGRLDRHLDQQALAHSFMRATKYLEQKLPSKAREWVKHAEEISNRLQDTDNQARCMYWFGRIDWFEGRQNDAWWHFKKASLLLPRGSDEMRNIPTYLQWLKLGPGMDRRRARLSRQGFRPPHESEPAPVSRKKAQGSALPFTAVSYNRYSHPGLKRKRENMEPDVAVALDLPDTHGRRRDRSRAVMTFESDRHIHPGEEVEVDPRRLPHLVYDFSWKRPQERQLKPPFNTFEFSRNPKKSRASRFRSHKIFAKQPWEKSGSRRTTRNRTGGKTDFTMETLTDELNSTPYQGLRYDYRRRR